MSSLRDRLLSSDFFESAGGGDSAAEGVHLDVEEDYSQWRVEGGAGEAAAAAAALTTGTAGTLAAALAAMGARPVAEPEEEEEEEETTATGTNPAATIAGLTSATAATTLAAALAATNSPTSPGGSSPPGDPSTTIDPEIAAQIARLREQQREIEAQLATLNTQYNEATTPDSKESINSQRIIANATLDGIKAQIQALEGKAAAAASGLKVPEGPLGKFPGSSASMEKIQTAVNKRVEELETELAAKKEEQKKLLADDNTTELEKAVIKDEITALEDKIDALKEGAFIDVLGDRYHLGKVEVLSGKVVVLPTDVSGTVRVSDVSDALISLTDPTGVMSFQQFLYNYGIHALNSAPSKDASGNDISGTGNELTETILQFRRFFNVDARKRIAAECTPKMLRFVYPYLVYRRGTLAQRTLEHTDENGLMYPGGAHFASLYSAFNDEIKKIDTTCSKGVSNNSTRSNTSTTNASPGHGDIMAKLNEILEKIKVMEGCESLVKCLDNPDVKAKIQAMLSEALGNLSPDALAAAVAKAAAASKANPLGAVALLPGMLAATSAGMTAAAMTPGSSPSGGPGSGSGSTTPNSPELDAVLKFLDLSIQAEDPHPAGLFSITSKKDENINIYNATNSMGAILGRPAYTNETNGASQREALMSVILAAIGHEDFNNEQFNFIKRNIIESIENIHNLAITIHAAQHALGYLNANQTNESRIKRLPISLSRVMDKLDSIATLRHFDDNEPFLFNFKTTATNPITNIKNIYGLKSSAISKDQYYSYVPAKQANGIIRLSINGRVIEESDKNEFINKISRDIESEINNGPTEIPPISILTKRQIEIVMLAAMREYLIRAAPDEEKNILAEMKAPEPGQLEHIAAVAGLTSAIAAASALTAAAAAVAR